MSGMAAAVLALASMVVVPDASMTVTVAAFWTIGSPFASTPALKALSFTVAFTRMRTLPICFADAEAFATLMSLMARAMAGVMVHVTCPSVADVSENPMSPGVSTFSVPSSASATTA